MTTQQRNMVPSGPARSPTEYLVRYSVAAQDADAHVAATRKFKDGMRADNDPDQRYDVYRETDEDGGVTFVHVAWMATDEDFQKFQATDYFNAFAKFVEARALEPPTVTPLISVAVDHTGLLGRANP